MLDFEHNTFANIPAKCQGPMGIMTLDNTDMYWDAGNFMHNTRNQPLQLFKISLDSIDKDGAVPAHLQAEYEDVVTNELLMKLPELKEVTHWIQLTEGTRLPLCPPY
ncbi:uncharacterized protein V1518DRAFT_324621 [Limtongia smithiae]|uniref:uncharacterized protein n=1 Tax=Limtongia smithiae TaxID=1125753 RepID=UPI0034CED8FC